VLKYGPFATRVADAAQRESRTRGRLVLLAQFACAIVALFGGLAVLSIGDSQAVSGSDPTANALRSFPLLPLIVVATLVSAVEALFWTVLFVEVAARAIQRPWAGALLGAAAYGVAYHWSKGPFAMLVASYVGAVLGVCYVAMRRRSRPAAGVAIVALRWMFVAFALASLRT
jgi:hypothetical protein